MLRVYPIFHSGFLVELRECCLLFDYYQGELPAVDPAKTLYVFVSHGHRDHYTPRLRELTARWPRRYFFTGGVAGAYYGVPEALSRVARGYLDARLLDILERFEAWKR